VAAPPETVIARSEEQGDAIDNFVKDRHSARARRGRNVSALRARWRAVKLVHRDRACGPNAAAVASDIGTRAVPWVSR